MNTDSPKDFGTSRMLPEESSGTVTGASYGADGRTISRVQPHETPRLGSAGIRVEVPGRDVPDFDRGPAPAKASSSEANYSDGYDAKDIPGRPAGDLADRRRGKNGTNVQDLAAAQELAAVFDRYLELVNGQHLTVNAAARLLGKSASMFSGQGSLLSRYVSGGVAALLPERREATAGDLTLWIESLGWFVPAAKFFYMTANSTSDRGSVPEAVRRTISLPNLPSGWKEDTRRRLVKAIEQHPTPNIEHRTSNEVPVCPPELREEILARQKAGMPLVPPRIARQISAPRAVTRAYRHKTNSELDFLNAAGSLFFFNDPVSGERRPPRAGEVIEPDDSTINFPVCVPWSLGGDPCSDRYGVKVGRFQWLVSIDAARRFITAWNYVMRPRSSYRAEDTLSLMHAHCVQHGVPLVWRCEGGAWSSNLVKNAIKAMGSFQHRVWSPHQKPYIEGLFNALWTKLSVQFPGSDVGRFRGETEEANNLLVACQRGSKDPRHYFPMLKDAVGAFDQVVAEKNLTPVNSDIGRWVPAEAWERRRVEALERGEIRRLDPESSWMFAPYQREWTVRGMLVGGRVPLFEDLSVPFDFTAPWLVNFDGARVRCHFDPREPRCQAVVVLLQPYNGKTAGTVLGSAQQINEVAGYARLVLGWADDPTNAGRLARQQNAAALRREVRAIVPSGRGYRASEERDGVHQVNKVEADSEHPTSNTQHPTSNSQEQIADSREISSDRERRPEVQLNALDLV